MGAKQNQAAEKATPPGLVEPEGGWPRDEFTGLEGEFGRDPQTGKRYRISGPLADWEQAAQVAQAPAQAQLAGPPPDAAAEAAG